MQSPASLISQTVSFMKRRTFLKLSGAALLAAALPMQERFLPAIAAPVRPNYPFPRHTTYTAGSIRPDHKTRRQLDQAVKNFYRLWRQRYVRAGCKAGHYVVMPLGEGGGKANNSISVSEGHGYGMILMALFAGFDAQAQTTFDGMYRFFLDHPSRINRNLMAWNQAGRTCRDANGAFSATDGDMDIAYALLLADQQWGSGGVINYRAAAVRMIEAGILAGDINPVNYHPTFGDWVKPSEPTYYYATRTSDFMVEHLRAYEAATGNSDWAAVRETCYNLVEHIQALYSPETGLLPDFIQEINNEPYPPAGVLLESETDGDFSYNACRTPWRLATDYLINGEPRAYAAVNKMTDWIKDATGGDPTQILGGYHLDGTPVNVDDSYSMAFIAPFGVGAMVNAAHQDWLNAIWDLVVAEPLNDEDYYGNTLKLLAMVVMSGNWWSPATVASQGAMAAAAEELGEAADATEEELPTLEALPADLADNEADLVQRIYLPFVSGQ